MKWLGAVVLVVCLAAGVCWAKAPRDTGNELRSKPLPSLLAGLKDPDPRVRVRSAALICNGETKDGRVVEPLAEALKDESPVVRELAAVGLGKVGDARAVPLLAAAAKDEVPAVRAGVARGLGYQAGDEALAALCGLLTDSEWWVRVCAAESLPRAGGARAVDVLLPLLKDPNVEVRQSAAKGLGEIGDWRAFGALMDAALDRNEKVAQAAVHSLGALRTGRETADDQQAWQRLRATTRVDFEQRDLKEVLDFVRDKSGVRVQADWTALQSAGIAPNAKVTLQASEISYVGVLVLALGQAEGTGKAGFVVKDGVLHVSTRAEPEQLSGKSPPPATVAPSPAAKKHRLGRP